MGKVDVNGDKAEPLFEWLKSEKPGLLGMKRVKWNFEKWLVGKDGKVAGRWASTTKPEALEKTIMDELAKGSGPAVPAKDGAAATADVKAAEAAPVESAKTDV